MGKVVNHRPGSKEYFKAEIRKMVQDVNSRFFLARNEDKMTNQLEEEEKRLRRYGSKPSIIGKNRGDVIGLGFHKKPSKEFLKRQYGELKRILKKDIWTSQGEKEEKEREDKAYESFAEFHPDWSKEKWVDFVQLLGSAPIEILQAFHYERSNSHKTSKTARVYNSKNEGFVETFSYAYDNDIDLLRVMEVVYRDIKGEGFSQEKALDLLKEHIKNEIADREERERLYQEWQERRGKS